MRTGERFTACEVCAALCPVRGWYEWNEKEQVRADYGRKIKQPFFISSPGSVESFWVLGKTIPKLLNPVMPVTEGMLF